MKNLFVFLVLVASGYLVFTQTKAGDYVVAMMPKAQFEKIHQHLSNKLDKQLTTSLPELIAKATADLQQSYDEKVAELAVKHVELSETQASPNHDSSTEFDALVLHVNELTNRLNVLTHINEVQAKQLESQSLTKNDLPATNTVDDLPGLNAISKTQVNLVSNNVENNVISRVDSDVNTKVNSAFDKPSSDQVLQQKLKLQNITKQMNQQTLALLTN